VGGFEGEARRREGVHVWCAAAASWAGRLQGESMQWCPHDAATALKWEAATVTATQMDSASRRTTQREAAALRHSGAAAAAPHCRLLPHHQISGHWCCVCIFYASLGCAKLQRDAGLARCLVCGVHRVFDKFQCEANVALR